MTSPKAAPEQKIRDHYPEEIFPIPGLEKYENIKYKIVNIVIIGYLSKLIDLHWLCQVFPIMEIENFVKKTKKMSIPYYGYEDRAVSCIFGDTSRGIRKIAKPLKNIMYLDYQFYGKNQHMKISKDNIHITGIRSENSGQVCIRKVLEKIRRIENLIQTARALSLPDKEFIMHCINCAVPIEQFVNCPEATESSINVYEFLMVNADSRREASPSKFFEFIQEVLCGTRTICEGDIDVQKFTVHNKVFYIDMNYNINLRKLNRLAHKNGHNVIFYNILDVQNTILEIKNLETGEIYACLKIQKSGGVNFWCGPEPDKSFQAFRIALPFIEKCFTTPCSSKRVHVRKTPRGRIE